MRGPDNDRWWGDVPADRLGRHRYTVQGLGRPLRDLAAATSRARIEAGQDVRWTC